MLAIGTKAPSFTLPDKDNNQIILESFKGKKIVLYFYPKDNTPGCTKQACAFKNAYDGFKTKDIVVIGISKDSTTSHQKFADKYELPFILLADTELVAIKAYDVWQKKNMYGKIGFGVARATFVIDENGIIEMVFKKANPDTNAQDILDYLEE